MITCKKETKAEPESLLARLLSARTAPVAAPRKEANRHLGGGYPSAPHSFLKENGEKI